MVSARSPPANSHSQNSNDSSQDSSSSKKEKDSQILEYVSKFKIEVDEKYAKSKTNKKFKLIKENFQISKKSFDSLENVVFYDLESQNVKKQLMSFFEEPKKCENINLANIVSKMGQLDTRYLASQFKNVNSPIFKLLLNGFKEKLKKENILEEFKEFHEYKTQIFQKEEFIKSGRRFFEKPRLLNFRNKTNFQFSGCQKCSPIKLVYQSTNKLLTNQQFCWKKEANENKFKFISSRENKNSRVNLNSKEISIERSFLRTKKVECIKSPELKKGFSAFLKPESLQKNTKSGNFNILLNKLRKKESSGGIPGSFRGISNQSTSNSKKNFVKTPFLASKINNEKFNGSSGLNMSKDQLKNMIHMKMRGDKKEVVRINRKIPFKELSIYSNKVPVMEKTSNNPGVKNSFWEKFKLDKCKLI